MLRISALAGAALMAGALSAQAATMTLFDDNFDLDSEGVSGFTTVTSLTNWNVTQGNVDTLDTSFGCTGCIDLDGTGSPAPAILVTNTALNFLANVNYSVSLFFSGGSESEAFTFLVDGLVGYGSSAGAGASTPSFGFSFGPDPITTTLSITLGGPVNNFGPYLDRVLITYDAPAPVPLPAAAPLLLAGLGALGLFARRRRG